METTDRIAMAALVVSVIAIVVATSAAVFTGKQYFLNEDRDQREIAAHQPTFQYTPVQQQLGRQWKLTIELSNRDDAKLMVDAVRVLEPQDGMLTDFDPTLSDSLKNASDLFPSGIPSHSSKIWSGFFMMHPQAAGATGKVAKIIYTLRFLGAPDKVTERETTFRLP